MKTMIEEFKAFALKGNAIELAVGVVIGTAFGKIVSSLVDDIFMPVLGLLINRVDFSTLAITIGDASVRYGLFINNAVNFLLVAFAIFIVIKQVNRMCAKDPASCAVDK